MCLQCHQHLTDEEVIRQFSESVSADGTVTAELAKFDKWNTTSLSHVLITGLGYNGLVAQNLAIKIYSAFLDWAKTQPKWGNERPVSGIECMPSIDDLERMKTELESVIATQRRENHSKERMRTEILDQLLDGILVRAFTDYNTQNEKPKVLTERFEPPKSFLSRIYGLFISS